MFHRNSPTSSTQNSNLPRRRFLQAMTAALPAAVILPKPGQAFSSDNPLLILEDERFETFKHLAAEERRLIDISNNAEPYDPMAQAKDEAASAASDALEAFMAGCFATPVVAPADLLLRARFTEFAELRYNSGGDVYHRYATPARNLASGVLEFLAANPSFGPLVGNVGDGARFLGVTSDDLQASIAADIRFAKLDDLIRKIMDLEIREEAAFDEHDAATIASCKSDPDVKRGTSPWCVLHGRYINEMAEFAKAEGGKPRGALDLILQWKIADYYFAVGDVGFLETNAICKAATSHAVEFFGLTAQTPIANLKPPPKPAKRSKKSNPVVEGRRRVDAMRQKIRKAGADLRNALKREASLDDGTPAHLKAMSASSRRQNALDRLTDETLGMLGDLTMADGYQLQCELLIAQRSEFLSSPSRDRAGQILQSLLKFGQHHGELENVLA